MSNIQSNINQMLSVAGVMANLNPTLKAKAEARQQQESMRKESESLSSQYNVLAKKRSKVAAEQRAIIREKQGELARQQFEMDPSDDTYNALLKIKKKSNSALKAAQSQKREAKQAIENLPTNLGGKVGDLEPKVQDFIKTQLEKETGNGKK